MSHFVYVSVQFRCDDELHVASLAERHIGPGLSSEAESFLDAMVARKGYHWGPKGGAITWGIVGNYTAVAELVEQLSPFFAELLRSDTGTAPHRFSRVLVLYESEQVEAASAYEMSLEVQGIDEYGPLVVRHFERLPFSLGV